MTAIVEPRTDLPGLRETSVETAAPSLGRWIRSVARWAAEVALLAALYSAYARIRDNEGAEQSIHAVGSAQAHGLAVLHLEQGLGLAWEHGIQRVFFHVSWLLKCFDVFYAVAHVGVTAAVLMLLAVAARRRYSLARNALAIGTAIALIVFALDPTMPPRLLDQSHAVDTLATVGGVWSFHTPAIEKIADPFAAMPSLHLLWAVWCAAAMWSLCRRRWQRRLAAAYPILTGVVVVATGNHWLLDLVAGAVLAWVSWWLALRIQASMDRRSARRGATPAGAVLSVDGLVANGGPLDRALETVA